MPNDDRHDDEQLRALLREWQLPSHTPLSLEQRVLGSRGRQSRQSQTWWRFLFSGYIRVPVPVACGLAVLLTMAVWRFAAQAPSPCVAERAAAPASRVARDLPPARALPAARTLPPDGCDHPAPGVC